VHAITFTLIVAVEDKISSTCIGIYAQYNS